MPEQDTVRLHPLHSGDQAWKETQRRNRIRNADTRKAGKVERETYERKRETVRHGPR